MKSRRKIFLVTFLGCMVAASVFHERVGIAAAIVTNRFSKRSIGDRLGEFGGAARQRMKNDFSRAGAAYPPNRMTLLVLKAERRLEVYASASNGLRYVRAYPILAASGGAGPKLREGDRQVPEGIYGIESLNPNSAYHVSLRLNYPNTFDRAQAKNDGRTALGGDIMIHGKSVSIGCVAIGDEAAEEIFTLAADSGIGNVTVVCSPVDLRKQPAPSGGAFPAWSGDLYAQIKSAMNQLPGPTK